MTQVMQYGRIAYIFWRCYLQDKKRMKDTEAQNEKDCPFKSIISSSKKSEQVSYLKM